MQISGFLYPEVRTCTVRQNALFDILPCERRGIKGTVRVISSDPPCKDDNVRFATVPLKALSDQVWIRHQCFSFIKPFFSSAVSLWKWSAHFCSKSQRRNSQEYTLFESDKGFKGYRFNSGIVVFACMVSRNYAYSPFKVDSQHLQGLLKSFKSYLKFHLLRVTLQKRTFEERLKSYVYWTNFIWKSSPPPFLRHFLLID